MPSHVCMPTRQHAKSELKPQANKLSNYSTKPGTLQGLITHIVYTEAQPWFSSVHSHELWHLSLPRNNRVKCKRSHLHCDYYHSDENTKPATIEHEHATNIFSHVTKVTNDWNQSMCTMAGCHAKPAVLRGSWVRKNQREKHVWSMLAADTLIAESWESRTKKRPNTYGIHK